jgi:hypothetical protein
MILSSTSGANTPKKSTTQSRYQKVRKRIDELYATKVEGIRLDYDGILEKVAEEFDYSLLTVKRIVKRA